VINYRDIKWKISPRSGRVAPFVIQEGEREILFLLRSTAPNAIPMHTEPLPNMQIVPIPEIEVKEIILAKVSRLCQLSSHSRGFLSRVLIFKSKLHRVLRIYTKSTV
jgi:hypothetical protein